MIAEDGATWTYDGAWHRLDGTPLEGRSYATLVYNPQRDNMILFGGTKSSSLSNEIFQLSVTTATASWSPVDPIGAKPVARQGHAMCALRGTRSIVLFGGQGAAGALGDTWDLSYRSATPDEDCSNAIDDDGDLQIDDADPDCP